MLAQEEVLDKVSELAAIPPLLERLGAEGGLKGALVSTDAIATNAEIAQAITDQGSDYLLAVRANQPTLRAERRAKTTCPPYEACARYLYRIRSREVRRAVASAARSRLVAHQA